MRVFAYLAAIAAFVATAPPAVASPDPSSAAPWTAQALPPELKRAMEGVSWRPGCPVRRDQLRLVHLLHVDFQGRERVGRLVVNEKIAAEVIAIFRELRRLRFPIEKITLIDDYGGDDRKAMADNATTAFNCREVEGKPGVFSKHAYGLALDLNPVLNPYHAPGGFSPPNSAPYVRRTPVRPGMIVPRGKVVPLFESRGWTWGGRWANETDYQHFDKRDAR